MNLKCDIDALSINTDSKDAIGFWIDLGLKSVLYVKPAITIIYRLSLIHI